MPRSISRLVLGVAPQEVPHEPAAAPANFVEPFPAHAAAPRSAHALATLNRLLAARPSLAEALPDHLSSPSSRLLYLAAHRELSEGLGAFDVPVGAHDAIRRQRDGSLLLTSPGAKSITLNNRHDDLAQLLEGANAWEGLELATIDSLLEEGVHRFYGAAQFDGGGAAANERGGRAFTYATIQQVLVSPDPSQRGLECLGSAAVHLWKSMGLVPPGLTREEFERRFTSIHGDRGGAARLGPEFNRTLRGGRSEVRLDAAATAAFANALKADDWAKLTGAANGTYSVRTIPNTAALVAHFASGGAGVRTTWADGGHYFVLTGASELEGELFVNEDDSLRRAPAERKSESDEPYRTPFSEQYHTRFWTLERR